MSYSLALTDPVQNMMVKLNLLEICALVKNL